MTIRKIKGGVMERIAETYIEDEMRESYINYAMSVIRGRAIPDVRDGLKPVQRRILYTMYQLGLLSNRPHRKAARIVGECFVSGTLVAMDKGLVPIEAVKRGDRVYTEGGLAEVTELYVMPPRPLYRVELENGLSNVVTASQAFRVLETDLSYSWKIASELKGGDWIVLRSSYPECLEPPVLPPFEGREKRLNESLAYLLGLLISDGWVSLEGRRHRLGFYSSQRVVMEYVAEILEAEFGHRPTIERKPPKAEGLLPGYAIRISRDAINDYLIKTFELAGWRAPTKRIPLQVLAAPKPVIFAFLSGLIDGDGNIHKERNLIRYTSVSRRLIDDLQVLLHHLNIAARRYSQLPDPDRFRSVNGRQVEVQHPYYCLEISGHMAQSLAQKLSLAHPEKRASCRALMERDARIEQSGHDLIPNGSATVFEVLRGAHLGGGWYRDLTGAKFRQGIKYPTGAKIRYGINLTEKPLHKAQVEAWGILKKLERIGSPLADRLRHFLEDGIIFARVAAVTPCPPEATYDLGVRGEHQFIAQGMVVHNCMGKYHPHGDQAIYDTLVNMAQDFSFRYPLIDGQGNFGSIDGDEPAAMRYTEARLSEISERFLDEIEEETVDFIPNFDDSLKEPLVLPAKLPNLLLNGSWGISVGMTTQIPPHNLGEVIEALIYLIDNPQASLEELMKYIKGPDFPTGGIILGRDGIERAYLRGDGKIRMRAKVAIEEDQIIVTEIPYQVRKSTIVETIAQKVKSTEIEEIADLRDESDREGLRIVIELKRGANPQVVLNKLYRYTPLEWTFGANFLSIVDGNPRKLSLKELLEKFILFRKEVVRRRTAFRLKVAEERAHILEGLKQALANRQEVVEIISKAKDGEAAMVVLKERFALSERQAEAILKMRLRQFTGLEREKVDQEYQEKLRDIKEYKHILQSATRLDELIKSELIELKGRYADERRTQIIVEGEEPELNDEALIPDYDLLVGITTKGYANAPREDVYRKQNRGGKGVICMRLREGDGLKAVFTANSRDHLLLFSNKHKVYKLRAFQLPSGKRDSKGENLRSLIELAMDEEVCALIPLKMDAADNRYCLMATARGIINRNPLQEYYNSHKGGIIALNAASGDRIVDVTISSGQGEIILATAKGQTIRFLEHEVRCCGRPSKGVIGMRPDKDDRVVAMVSLDPGDERDKLLLVTENGYGKRTFLKEFRRQGRGGFGILGIKVDNKTGQLIALEKVKDDDEIMVTTALGKIIRIAANDVRLVSRYAKGVKLINLDEGDKVVSVEKA